jgi:isocitrate dehydrogenase (NAD+)
MSYRITLIPGDGIGPEVIDATIHVLDATGIKFDFEEVVAGEQALNVFGDPLPEETLNSIRQNKVALKGPVTTPVGEGFRSINVLLRQTLDLYANLRPAKSFKGVPSKYQDVDLIVVRENTEGLYSGIEKIDKNRSRAESVNLITRAASERIVKFAFEYSAKEGRKKVTAVHKANILKASGGLFLESARSVAKSYPKIEFEDRIVDNMAMQLVKNPGQFDVIVTTNLFGDILSDLCAGLVGGLGLAPGANIGNKYAVFEPVHGSAPKHAGLNKINPIAAILSSVLMLKYLDERKAAQLITRAVERVLLEGKIRTFDLGGTASTSEISDAIIAKMDEMRT